MKTNKIILLSTLVALLVLTVCATAVYAQRQKTVTPSSNYVTHKLQKVKDFDGVRTATSIDIEYTQTQGEPSVSIYCPDNILEILDVEVSGRTLVATLKRGYNVRGRMKVVVTASSRELNNASASSSGDVKISGTLNSDNFKAMSSSSGDIEINNLYCSTIEFQTSSSGDIEVRTVELKGNASLKSSSSGDINIGSMKCANISAIVSSSGDVEVGALECTNATFQSNSSGDIKISRLVGNVISASASSSGTITLKGEVKSASYVTSSSGTIYAKDLMAETATASCSSGGDIYCYASKTLTTQRSTSGGKIYYYGNPELIDSSTNKGIVKM